MVVFYFVLFPNILFCSRLPSRIPISIQLWWTFPHGVRLISRGSIQSPTRNVSICLPFLSAPPLNPHGGQGRSVGGQCLQRIIFHQCELVDVLVDTLKVIFSTFQKSMANSCDLDNVHYFDFFCFLILILSLILPASCYHLPSKLLALKSHTLPLGEPKQRHSVLHTFVWMYVHVWDACSFQHLLIL